ncbi:hypothetical protein F5X96DRAFT_666491 [Biscogniauxia mediterranea]|nr:hypothetical protein F5X96DRAFT_666491 [Biscogniauxia mediterranea]
MALTFVNETIIKQPEAWLRQLLEYIDGKSPLKTWMNFGRMLRFSSDTRQLAASALQALQRKFDLHIDLRHGGPSTKGFAGAHLRTEQDTKYSVALLESGGTPENITVVTKQDLLDLEKLEHLDRLSWDQQA